MPLYQLKSLRQLREELTGIRLAAANTSLWNIAASINNRARVALNDAIKTYPYFFRSTNYSIVTKGDVAWLPHEIDRILEVRVWNSSLTQRTALSDWEHAPTAYTNLLRTHIVPKPDGARWLEIEYEARIHELPENLGLGINITAAPQTPLEVGPRGTGRQPMVDWPPQGYIEIHRDDAYREIAYYSSLNPDGGVTFQPVTGEFWLEKRGLFGTVPLVFTAATSVTISAVLTYPPESLSVFMSEAQATMYEYWASHRADYSRYTSVVGLQAMDVADILALARTMEAKAERRFRRLKIPPNPTTVKIRRRRDRK